jgi:hypothetical protein
MKAKSAFVLFAAVSVLSGCASAESETNSAEGAALSADAKLEFTANFNASLEGRPKAGGTLEVHYALARLARCRSVVGGMPAWNVTGYYSENGGPARSFEVTSLSANGRERTARVATLTLSQGGDLALWFQGTDRYGCSEYDSDYGRNFHVAVDGATASTEASLVFFKDGRVHQDGALRVGGRLKVRYEQERLPSCRRTQAGKPVWGITGFAELGGQTTTFETARIEGADRMTTDAWVELPHAGELSLWFESTSLGGCHEVDANQGTKYRYAVQ